MCVQAGGRGALMAHNSVNQIPCHASSELMGWLRAQGNMSGAFLGMLVYIDWYIDSHIPCALAVGDPLSSE